MLSYPDPLAVTPYRRTRIVFINPLSGIDGCLPIGLSYLLSTLCCDGFAVELFDTIFYETTYYNERKDNEALGAFIPVDMACYGLEEKKSGYVNDLRALLEETTPQLIAMTVPTGFNRPLALELLDAIEGFPGFVVLGGKAVTVSPNKYLEHPRVNAVCVGEGEEALRELAIALEEGRPFECIPNLWFKASGSIIENPLRPLKELDELPLPYWKLFDKRHFYRPFRGKVYRAGLLELTRGCPHHCSYCINDGLQKLYSNCGRYFRKKSVGRAITEIAYLKKHYDLEFIRFWDDEFLFYSDDDFEEFAQQYKTLNLPFVASSRSDRITERKAALLKEMGCVNLSTGIESGNEEFRRRILNRHITNEQIIRGIRILGKYGLRVNALNIIGLPFETRRLFFNTVRLNKKARPESSTSMIFQPWEGTALRDICIRNGFVRPETEITDYMDSALSMPQLSRQEILGLRKTFNLYVKTPSLLHPLVRLCEKNSPWRTVLFRLLNRLFPPR